jgi:hypothetical protein
MFRNKYLSEQYAGRDVEGSGCDVIAGATPAYAWRDRIKA